ncbi:unnamed protein product [Sphenostylis stenocarpa]|uniref:Uncharacterized protein n=1 Tax=Sphenostylis stenocarpa TaxID=92480 RepID=A0AA86VC68_9FABA|nr:unnamed protein product [Sphenostylis stenocarpa]
MNRSHELYMKRSQAIHAEVTGCTANFTCSQLIELEPKDVVVGLILSSLVTADKESYCKRLLSFQPCCRYGAKLSSGGHLSGRHGAKKQLYDNLCMAISGGKGEPCGWIFIGDHQLRCDLVPPTLCLISCRRNTQVWFYVFSVMVGTSNLVGCILGAPSSLLSAYPTKSFVHIFSHRYGSYVIFHGCNMKLVLMVLYSMHG